MPIMAVSLLFGVVAMTVPQRPPLRSVPLPLKRCQINGGSAWAECSVFGAVKEIVVVTVAAARTHALGAEASAMPARRSQPRPIRLAMITFMISLLPA